MKKYFLLSLTILSFSIANGQNDFFKDISTFEIDSLSEKSTIVYTHFNGCAPCKRMDKEVLSLEPVQSYLNSSFLCFEVFGFDSLEKTFRTKYAITGDPTFLFLNNTGKEVHRITGYFDANQFLSECTKVHSSSSLSQLENNYSGGDYSLEEFRDYIHAKGRARQLDSTLISKYLDFIPDSVLLKRLYFEDIIKYSYYEGHWDQPLNSRYYNVIKQAYLGNLFADLKEEMRNRMIFTLYDTLYNLDQNSPVFSSLLDELKALETGDLILLKDPDSKGFFVLMTDRYPSFYFEYERAKSGFGNKSPSEVFANHVAACQNNDAELNTLAWGIYEEKYLESAKTGIALIIKAIEIKPLYAYYDTYAALLLKDGNLNEAKSMAKYAIELAKETNTDSSDTEKLLTIIESALLDEKVHEKKQ